MAKEFKGSRWMEIQQIINEHGFTEEELHAKHLPTDLYTEKELQEKIERANQNGRWITLPGARHKEPGD